MSKENWSSYQGFILASIASAVGLGNIWRFPYVTGINGGGTFLLVYIIIIFSFGLSLMVLEISVGRSYKSSIVGSFNAINKRFKPLSLITVGVTFLITSYYIVILGWVLTYLLFSILNITIDFNLYINTFYPIIAFIIALLINAIIIKAGVVKGIERISKYGMYILILILIPLTLVSLRLPNSEEGLRFYLTININKLLDPNIWEAAFGQAFFSLSIGTSILLTYGSYLKHKRSPIEASLIIISADFIFAFIAGLMIFSITFSFNLEPTQGPSLAFIAIPMIFSNMQFGNILSILFFLLLFIAGLTSSISMFQVPISALEDLGFKNNKVLIITLLLLIAGLPSALSYSIFNLKLFNTPFLDIIDNVIGSIGLIISSIIFIIIITWFSRNDNMMNEIGLSKEFTNIAFNVVRFIVPLLLIATLVGRIVL